MIRRLMEYKEEKRSLKWWNKGRTDEGGGSRRQQQATSLGDAPSSRTQASARHKASATSELAVDER